MSKPLAMPQPSLHPRGRAARAPVLRAFASLLLLLPAAAATGFSDIEPLLQQHCVECHGAKEPEGGLVLETHPDLMKGGENGVVVVPGRSADSLLVKALLGDWGKTGKNQFMPPGKRDKLKPEQVALFRAWIDAGAPAPKAGAKTAEIVVPRIAPKVEPRRSIHALAFSAPEKLLAVARHGEVDLVDVDSRSVVRVLGGARGAVNAIAFAPDGRSVFAAAGDPGISGEVRQWDVRTGAIIRVFEGHRDALYAVAVSPDGRTLATGSYDYSIRLWDVADGSVRKTITASQGAIYDLAFRPDGKVLASASADRTAKLYDVATGERIETFGQALKELNAVAWSPDGGLLVTGGGDNRIRVYSVGADAKEGSGKLTLAKFAHEGAILRLRFSADGRSVLSAADDRSVKIFRTDGDWGERTALEKQTDWPTAAGFSPDGKTLAVGRLDGSLGYYDAADGRPAAPPRPELQATEPRGIQRGVRSRVRLVGKNLADATVAIVRRGTVIAAMEPEKDGAERWIELSPDGDEPRGPWEIQVQTPAGDSARVKVWVDDLPQRTGDGPLPAEAVSVWGATALPGQTVGHRFTAKAGQTLVFDLAAKAIGSQGDFALTLLDAGGKVLAKNDSFDGDDDPWVTHTFAADGSYIIRVAEQMLRGSSGHFYRLSVGALPMVTGVYPVSVPADAETTLELAGPNLPDGGRATLKAGAPGETGLPAPASELRSRRAWKVIVTGSAAPRETEPNDTAAQAQKIPVPSSVNGRIGRDGDVDHFAFEARKGTPYVLETTAARRGSPLDTKITVLRPDGSAVGNVQLRAVRDSAITFRGTDANGSAVRLENWEEMELDEHLYFGGEVVKLFRMPQGPDSDMVFYSANGNRRAYFGTTAVSHPLDEPAYIVVPEPVGTQAPPNGLPVFRVDHENDDDPLRQLGTDSRIHFTAPEDGTFVVRVADARGFGSDRSAYRLVVREAEPGFRVTLEGVPAMVAPGSGQSFSVSAERIDGFEGAITVALDHLPPGWRASTPLVIEAGHPRATGTLLAAADATTPGDAAWDAVTVVATGAPDGRPVAMAAGNLGRPKLAKDPAKLRVTLRPDGVPSDTPAVIDIAPGTTVTARLSVKRNGFDGVVRFEVENLPHGVIVADLGLNGITLLENESERTIFINAARWVADLDRPVHAVETATGRQTSMPVTLRVRKKMGQAKGP